MRPLAIALACACSLWPEAAGGQATPAPPTRQELGARAELERAAKLRRALGKARGPERAALQAGVVQAFREVRARFPEQHELVAEACFRAAEVLRAAGASAEAAREFELAREHGAGSDWRARAGLELGHLERRASRHEQALRRYRAVLMDSGSASARRDEALLWAGRSCFELGQVEEARALWEQAAAQAEDPCDRIAAYDALALAWIDAGDLEAAAGELERCRTALRERALEETPLGARVRSALLHMRAVARLRRAVARRRAGVVVER